MLWRSGTKMYERMRFGGCHEWSCGFCYIECIHFVPKLFLYVQAVRLLIHLEHVHQNVI